MSPEEIVQLRSYLANQSMHRTPAQIADALQEAYNQFTAALHSLPENTFLKPREEGIWSAAEILEHTYLFITSYKQAICMVIEQGERPLDVCDRTAILPHQHNMTPAALLSALEMVLHQLIGTICQADPHANLDITWDHFELGPMHWREWLLFARVHLLDHVRQLQAMQAYC